MPDKVMNQLPSTTFSFPSTYHLGCGKIQLLSQVCQELNIQKPLIVSDLGIIRLPWFDRLCDQLKNNHFSADVFSAISPNPTDLDLKRGTEAFRKGQHDGCILLGGGSPMDAGKCIALVANQVGSLFDYEDIGDNWKRIDESKLAPTIAIPTTAGTGSEVGRAGVIVDTKAQRKKIIFHPKMMPKAVIADPELSYDLPSHLTAATGMDAFIHSFEAYCSPNYHPYADGIALEGMRLVKENLLTATRNGNNSLARIHMLVASSMGATAFQKGLGIVHAMAHPLGAHFKIHHGLANAILLPYCLVYNRLAIKAQMEQLARHLQLPTPGFLGFKAWVLQIRKELGIPHSLNQLASVDPYSAQRIASEAMIDPALSTNPRSSSIADLEALFLAAYHGDLDAVP